MGFASSTTRLRVPHPVQTAGPAYDFADLRAVWSMLVHVHSSAVGHSAARPLPSAFHLHHPTAASSADLLHRPDSLRAKLVQREPHESAGTGLCELLILLGQLAALLNGLVEGLGVEHGGLEVVPVVAALGRFPGEECVAREQGRWRGEGKRLRGHWQRGQCRRCSWPSGG